MSKQNRVFMWLARRKLLNWMPSNIYLKGMFRCTIGGELDLKKPQTFNEKMQWLKLYDHKPKYVTMVDKVDAKNYVSSFIGEQYIIPTLGVWNSVDEIDFNKLPPQFVLKCTHNSGGVIVCKDKDSLDTQETKRKLKKSLSRNYFWWGREWPYKKIKPRVIAEAYIENKVGDELTDYKFMCFGGIVKCVFTVTERFTKTGLKVTFFDRNWKRMPFERHYPASDKIIEKPNQFEKMIELAEKLSKNIPFVRVDFYESNNQIYFGELTFYPGSGFEEFVPYEWDVKLGDWLHLPFKDKEQGDQYVQ